MIKTKKTKKKQKQQRGAVLALGWLLTPVAC